MDNLFNILNINKDSKINIDKLVKNKKLNEEEYIAWKILRDKFYCALYKKYQNIDLIYKAGFINDKLSIEELDYYNLNLLTTPYYKILDNINNETKNPVVLLSTGGFYPIHNGHLDMMELAKKELIKKGYDVVGGYFSLSHNDYIKTKPFFNTTSHQRLESAQKVVENNSWIMIDPFESMWAPTYVNFTEIISRLELYLQKYIDKRIKVVYVCGDDNAEFMYCFETIGMGVCVERNNYEKFNDIKNKLKNNPNIFFIENNNETSNLSSRNIRKNTILENNKNFSGTYLIRNEGILPLKNLLKYKNEKELLEIQNNTLLKFSQLLKEAFNNKIEVNIVNVQEQIINADKNLQSTKTISLDSYYSGTYNLETSRMFEISDAQTTYTKLVGRSKNYDIKKQICNIAPGNYILVDDDSVSGNTLRSILNILPKNINIIGTYLLMQHKNIFDVVDFRDFILGINNSGLMVRLSNDLIARVPYIYPFINLNTRASIPLEKQKKFTLKIIDLNAEFYNNINSNIKINELDNNLKELVSFLGFSNDITIIEFLNWYKSILQKGGNNG